MTHKISSETVHIKKTAKRLELEALYQQVRDYRVGKNRTISRTKVLEQLLEKYPLDWLLPVELYELAYKSNKTALCNSILKHLENVKRNKPEVGQLIDDGVKIIMQTVKVQS